MKLIIDINDDAYEYISKLNEGITDYQTTLMLYEAVKNGTPIPDNATNRDVIEIMFPNEFSAKKSWWDAPYQKGDK